MHLRWGGTAAVLLLTLLTAVQVVPNRLLVKMVVLSFYWAWLGMKSEASCLSSCVLSSMRAAAFAPITLIETPRLPSAAFGCLCIGGPNFFFFFSSEIVLVLSQIVASSPCDCAADTAVCNRGRASPEKTEQVGRASRAWRRPALH